MEETRKYKLKLHIPLSSSRQKSADNLFNYHAKTSRSFDKRKKLASLIDEYKTELIESIPKKRTKESIFELPTGRLTSRKSLVSQEQSNLTKTIDNRAKVVIFGQLFGSRNQAIECILNNKKITNEIKELEDVIRQEQKEIQESSLRTKSEIRRKMPKPRVTNIEEIVNNKYLMKTKREKLEDFEAKDRSIVNFLKAVGRRETEYAVRPTSRINSAACKVADKVYFFAGIGLFPNKDFWIYDIEKKEWSNFIPKTADTVIPRYGHTMVSFRNTLIIYGGIIDKKYHYERENVGILRLNDLFYIQERNINKKVVKWRSHHVAISVGPHMLVHGGIDREGNRIEDIWLFNFLNYTWNRPHILFHPKASIPSSHHAAVLVVNERQKSSDKFNIYNFVSFKETQRKREQIAYEGIYFFGGLTEDGEYIEKLRIMKVGSAVLSWITPKTIGREPEGRLKCSMDYLESSNILIIHGGNRTNIMDGSFNDLFCLDLEFLVWMKIPVEKETPIKRSLHCSFTNVNDLVVFGGMNEETFESINLFTFSFYVGFDLKRKLPS